MNQRLRNIALGTLTLAAAMAGTSTAFAATASTRSIASTTAVQLAQQTVAACSAEGYNVSASVVDRSGVLLAMVRADGAGPHTAEASRAKAFTSASSRNPTSGIAKAIQSNPDAAGMANIPGFLVLGGGVPLKIGNETIGAIGVAGAPGGHLDEACAQKAITALKDQLQ
ncbi:MULTISPECIES: heme-binding protein [Comamonas]|uniref:GlcG n=1 Tax=Comamonas testosteroni TaxID=285 RepID=A0A096FD59_COMTE|nr:MULTISPECIES: heme-binding protein [Comamonas]KGH27708.1 GlcG [Comamonas testosteroni]MPT13075.1 heme-binding protein [Comamonas sp.]